MPTQPSASRLRKFLITSVATLQGGLLGLVIATPAMAGVPDPTAVVGSLPGQFSADQGSASYSIPIEVPPGIAGMQPELALSYSSQSGNGMAGIGWGLSGLSGVSRCGLTQAQDGEAQGLAFNSRDRFCLDGQRLIAVSGSYGADGTEYRTEMDGFTKIISRGAAGTGPAWFEAFTKSGQRIEYGKSADAYLEAQGRAEIKLWAINHIEDAMGNALAFTYFKDAIEGIHYPTQLSYGSSAVDFVYEDRPDPSVGYVAGSKGSMPVRLSRIAVSDGATLRREYRLQYLQTTLLNKSQLASVTHCDGTGTCHAPTTFAWNAGAQDFETPDAWVQSGVSNANLPRWGQGEYSDLIDMNGDGLPDRVADRDYYNGTGNGLWVGLNTGNGFAPPTRWFYSVRAEANRPSWGHEYTALIDLNGDGLPDRVGHYDYETGQGNGLWVALNTGSGFAPQTRWFQSSHGPANRPRWGQGELTDLIDMNGDGLPDRIAYYDYVVGQYGLWVALNTGAGFETPTLWFYSARAEANRPSWNHQYTALIDMNGDGLPDKVGHYDYDTGQGNGLWVALNTGSGFAPQTRWFQSSHGPANRPRWGQGELADLIDMNGDGLPDRIAYYNYATSQYGLWVALNTGAGFEPKTLWFNSVRAEANRPSWAHQNTALVDMNADGLPDRVGHYDYDGGQGYGLWVSLNTGSGFAPQTKWFYSSTANANLPRWTQGQNTDLIDLDGDGLPERVAHYDYDNGGGSALWVARNNTVRPMITGVTDALGSTITVEYQTTASGDAYQRETGAQYPLRDVQGAMYVVSRVSKTDGVGGESTTSYRYGGARSHILGRGFLGFAWDEVTDDATGITTRTEYHQDFPYSGMPKRVATRLPDGQVISESDSTYAVKTTDYPDTLPTPAGGSRAVTYTVNFPYLHKKDEKTYELDGEMVSRVQTWNGGYDDYGNIGWIAVVTTAGGEAYKKETTNTYDNDVTKWHLGRLRTAKVKHIHADGRTEIRKSAFEYDSVTGLLNKEIIEPDQPAYTQTTHYEYDTFGNKVSATVSGAGVTSRTTTSSYDPSGRFAVEVKNALNHAETRSYGSYAHCGAADSLTGPNGLTTSWQYDSFCRKTGETRADGTQFTITRAWADPATDANAPDNAVYYVQEQSTGTPPVTKYFDILGRAIRAVSIGFDGRPIYQDTVYDAQGRELKSSLPYYPGDISFWAQTEYDILNRVTRKVFETGKETITTGMAYDGLTTTETNTLGQGKITTKNAQGKVSSVVEEEGAYVTYQYDPVGNLTHTTQGDINTGKTVTTRMGYDLRGRKIWMQDPDMSGATCNPDLSQFGGCWTYQYNTFGELVGQTDAKGQTVTMGYDALGRMTSRTEPEGSTTWTYDTAIKGIGKLAVVAQYDAAIPAQLQFKQQSFYDQYGRPISAITSIAKEGGGFHSFTTSSEYDANGRVVASVQPGNFRLVNEYNEFGYLVARKSPATQVTDYDSSPFAGLYTQAAASATAALNKAAWYAQEAAYLESKADEYAAVIAAQAQEQRLANDAPELGDGRGYLLYTDANGDLYAESPATFVMLHGAITVPIKIAPENHYKLYQNADGTWSFTVLDAATWFLQRPTLTATGEKLFVGDFNANGVRDFRRLAANANDGLTDNATLQRLAVLAADIRAAANLLNDRADNAIALAQQLVAVAANVRDAQRQAEYWASADGSELNQMAADADAGMVTWWRATARDAAGRLSAHRLGNGLLDLRDYDPATGRLNAIQTGFGYGNLHRHLEYEYDGLNNVTARYDNIQDVREEFAYDRLNRLTAAHVGGTAAGVAYDNTINYSYDALGNMTHKSDVGDYLYGDPLKGNGANAGPHAVSRTGDTDDYVYDDNGSITRTKGRNITWTSFNKPYAFNKDGTVVKFIYGPDRARYKKTVGGEIGVDKTTLYLGKGYERIEDSAGNVTHKYFINTEDGVTAIHVRHKPAGGAIDPALDESRYLHRDSLGSIDTITDGQGNIIERMGYSPFGARRGGDWTSVTAVGLDLYTNRGFTGHEHIEEMGLIHMNGRVYDPEIGRFLSADPYVQSPHSSQSYNRYAYVQNNPLKYTDPSGHFLQLLFAAVAWLAETIAFYTALEIVAATALASAIVYGAVAGFVLSTGFALANGVPIGKALKMGLQGALWGAITAGVTWGIGHGINWAGMGGLADVSRAVTHGMAQGLLGAARGGKFKSGFFGGVFGSIAGSFASKAFKGSWLGETHQGKLLVAAVAGGTASEIGGGKFGNGAISGAFVYLFNECGNGCDWDEGWDRLRAGDLPPPTMQIRLSKAGLAYGPNPLKVGATFAVNGETVAGIGAWSGGGARVGEMAPEPQSAFIDIFGGLYVKGVPVLDKTYLQYSGEIDFLKANASHSGGSPLGRFQSSTSSIVPPSASMTINVFFTEWQLDYGPIQ